MWLAVIVGGPFIWIEAGLGDEIKELGLRHPMQAAVGLTGLLALGAAVWYGYLRSPASPWMIAVGVLWVLVAFSVYSGYNGRDGGSYIGDYCGYGAVSQAQLDGCLENVDERRIDRARTEAGRFARGELMECGADSGPFCQRIASERIDDALGP